MFKFTNLTINSKIYVLRHSNLRIEVCSLWIYLKNGRDVLKEDYGMRISKNKMSHHFDTKLFKKG